MNKEKIVVVGLGYVGLPLAVAFAEEDFEVWGFDVDGSKIAWLKRGVERAGILTNQLELFYLKRINFLNKIERLPVEGGPYTYIVCVPTPIKEDKSPDLGPLISACEILKDMLQEGDMVVFESTVYPGVTEEVCLPILAGRNIDGDINTPRFHLAYSPERVNPGDQEHTVRTITKLVAADGAEALNRAAEMYRAICPVKEVATIREAEMAKAIENAQRDINIAFVNEISIICEKSGLNTKRVLEAASTKWNFLNFKPGLVGGHCIGVDPYYLSHYSEKFGHHPTIILGGRRINDRMAAFVGRKTVQLMAKAGIPIPGPSVCILGVTFKPDVTDFRNTKVVDITVEMRKFGVFSKMFDDSVNKNAFNHEYDSMLCEETSLSTYSTDVLMLAVPHKRFLDRGFYQKHGINPKIVVDISGAIKDFFPDAEYWSL